MPSAVVLDCYAVREVTGVKKERLREGSLSAGLLSNSQRKDDLWIEALSRLQWLGGRQIREGNGYVSFTWRVRGWMPLCSTALGVWYQWDRPTFTHTGNPGILNLDLVDKKSKTRSHIWLTAANILSGSYINNNLSSSPSKQKTGTHYWVITFRQLQTGASKLTFW